MSGDIVHTQSLSSRLSAPDPLVREILPRLLRVSCYVPMYSVFVGFACNANSNSFVVIPEATHNCHKVHVAEGNHTNYRVVWCIENGGSYHVIFQVFSQNWLLQAENPVRKFSVVDK